MRLLIVLLLALPVLARAQGGFFAWWDSPIAKDINLSDSQMRDVRSTVREYRGRLIDLRAQLEKAEVELGDAFDDESFDPRRASDAVDKVVAARGDLIKVLSQMNIRLRGILTNEQWRELQKRRPRQNLARPGGGPAARNPQN